MSDPVRMIPVCLLLAIVGDTSTSWAITPEDQASIASQCRQDAETYDIPPEQMADYVDGCILSMGGYPSSPPEADPSGAIPAEQPVMDDSAVEDSISPDIQQ